MAQTLEKPDDESLMERLIQNDHQAFSILVTRHSDKFYGAAFRIVMNQQEAEDIVQDAFLKLWDKPKIWKAGKGAKFTTWFYRIVMNLALDVRRKTKHTTSNLEDELRTTELSQDKKIIEDEEQKLLSNALNALPEKQLMALNLCFYEDHSNKEAADIMGVSVKALESLLMRAKAGMKDYLHRSGVLKQGDVA